LIFPERGRKYSTNDTQDEWTSIEVLEQAGKATGRKRHWVNVKDVG